MEKNNWKDCKINLSKQLTLCTVLLIAFCIFFSGCYEKTQELYNVGILSGLDYIDDAADGFKTKMTTLGYIEGENIVYDLQKTNFDMSIYKNILKKFVSDKVDLIFVFPTEASQEAKLATEGTGIPVVFAIANIEGTDLIDSIQKPGGNITGVRYPGPDIALKRFEIMNELVPNATSMWIPYQRGYPIASSQLDVLHAATSAVGVSLIEAPADNASELQIYLDARANLDDIGIDAILFLAEPLAVTNDAFKVMGKFADEYNIPIGGALMIEGDYESVFGVHVDSFAVGMQAAFIADKIFRGAHAGDIPVVSAENYVQINYGAAQKLGLNVSEGLLSMADEIIQ